eukprot:2417526-Prymnesium_polylepis.1
MEARRNAERAFFTPCLPLVKSTSEDIEVYGRRIRRADAIANWRVFVSIWFNVHDMHNCTTAVSHCGGLRRS